MISDEKLEEMIKKIKLCADTPFGIYVNDLSSKDAYSVLIELKKHRDQEKEIMKIFQNRAAKEIEIQKNRNIQDKIIQSVLVERQRQDKKWGEQNHHPQLWTGILGEEFGELCQAINETVFDNGKEERKKGGYANMREEAIHVAAVAISFLECLERNKDKYRNMHSGSKFIHISKGRCDIYE